MCRAEGDSGLVWGASEANARVPKPASLYFSRDFSHDTDFHSYLPDGYRDSMLMLVQTPNGKNATYPEEPNSPVVWYPPLPKWMHWDKSYSWHWSGCKGNRVFLGMHYITTFTENSNRNPFKAEDGDGTTFVVTGTQSPIAQDGAKASAYWGGRLRVMQFAHPADDPYALEYKKAWRYDTQHMEFRHRSDFNLRVGARHFVAVFCMLALSETQFLVCESEDYSPIHPGEGDTFEEKNVLNRLWFVEFSDENIVPEEENGETLNILKAEPVQKRLIYSREHNIAQLDGIMWGPKVPNPDGSGDMLNTIMILFEGDRNFGGRFELLTLDPSVTPDDGFAAFKADGIPFAQGPPETAEDVLARRITAFIVLCMCSIALLFGVRILMIVLDKRDKKNAADSSGDNTQAVKEGAEEPAEEEMTKREAFFKRDAIYYLACMNSFLLGGLTFGYPFLILSLQKLGIFATNCACGTKCSEQKASFSALGTIGFACSIGMRIFFGFLLDRFGPKVTAGFTNLLCVIGLGLFVTDSPEVLQDRIMAAWVLLSAGGGGLHLSGFHAKNVYPTKKWRGVKAAGISAAFGASSLMFLTWLVMSDLGAGFAVMAGVHTAIAIVLLFLNVRCQPWRAGKPGEVVDIRKQTLFGGSDEDADRRRVLTRHPNNWSNFGTVLKTMVFTKKYLLLVFWFSCNLLLQTHYLSSIFYTLYTLGDASLTTQYYKTNLKVSDWRDYMFFKAASILNGCGFLWFPLVQRTMTYLNWSTRFALVVLTQAIMVLLLSFVEKLEVHFATFLLQGLSRLMLFTFYHAFIAEQFGMSQFGKLVGIGTLAASIVGLLSYPLQLIMTYDYGGDYSMSYLFIGAGVLASAALPIWLRIQERADAAEADADAVVNEADEAPTLVTGVVTSGDGAGKEGRRSTMDLVDSSSDEDTPEDCGSACS